MSKYPKKVGIITYFYFLNYGTMLQAYALEHCIERLSDSVTCEIINYVFGEKTCVSQKHIIKTRIKRFFHYLFECKRVVTVWRYRGKMQCRKSFFDSFVSDKMKLSRQRYVFAEELKKEPPLYDIYITGSDQTWSPKIGFNPALFLDFVKKTGVKAAYAPSVGVTSFTPEEQNYLREHLKDYKFLSCRESVGARLLEEITGRKVSVVLDPTLMVKAEDWNEIAVKPTIGKPYILCYFLGDRSYCRKFVKDLSKEKSLPVYYVPVSWVDCKKKNNLLFDIGPSEFLGLIQNAQYVCTDSFHGVAFCVNFNKQFFAFTKHEGNVGGGDNSRLYDFLQRMGLSERLMTAYEREKLSLGAIDYEQTNRLLAEERKMSEQFLRELIYG